ncbi:MAG: amino acid permease [Fretibacterium sp.]|nr:amino acid permease [Fretibacterium sp.]
MEKKHSAKYEGSMQTPYLSPLGAWALAFGCAIGWGAFILPGTTFLPKAGPMGTIIGIAIGAVLMLVIAFNYHFMMNHHSGSGGAFSYARAAFGYDHGFLCAWFLILTYVVILWANASALVIIFRELGAGLLRTGFHYQIAGYDVFFGEVAVSIGMVLLAGIICIRSKNLAGAIQTLMAVLLFGGILFCLGAVVSGMQGYENLKPWFMPAEKPYIQILQVATLVPWAFVGFESVSHSTGEFRFSPRKSFAVMASAVVTAGLAYVLLTWLAASAQPEGHSNWLSHIEFLRRMDGVEKFPVFFAIKAAMGRAGIVILAVMLMAAVVTGILGNYIAASRLLYALAGDGILPGRIHALSRSHTPAKAIFLIMLFSAFIPFLGGTAMGWLVDVTSVGATIAYGYTSAAAFRMAHQEGRRGPKLIGALGVLISVVFLLMVIVPNFWSINTMAAESYLILTVWGFLGLGFFRFIIGKDHGHRFGKSMVAWGTMLILLFFVSAVWMRQGIYGEIKHYIDDDNVCQIVNASLIRNNMLQMGLYAISLAILFSIFSIMSKREKQLQAERIQAERANAAKSEFLANMSHEIRTPINAVLGMNEMIIRESRDKRITTFARNVESAGKNLLAIINDILDFSKIEAGRMEIVEADYRLSSVLNDVTNMIMFKAKQKSLDFHIDVDDTLPDVLFGDSVRERQIVVNILNNAVKYTHEGSVSFRVGGEQAGNTLILVFQVKDTGIGIRQEDLPRLFGKFQRVDLARNSTVEGTGLGLSIAKNLLETMGGKIEVESEYGKGSTFTLHLPQKIVSHEPIGDFQKKFEQYIHSMRAYRESFKAPDARILVVDDTEMNLTVVEELLAKTEVRIDKATSGINALALTEKTHYDLILMDNRMPQMDGTETMNRIHQQDSGANQKTPVICLTADAVSGAKARYISEGFTDYLSKPIEGALLEAALIKYLPAEKVVLQEESGDIRDIQETIKDMTELESFYAGIKELNYGDAIRFCSNERVLKKTLDQFYHSIKSNANAIDGFLMEKDYRNFTIRVHALKSSARLIGANALSSDARYLENLGNSLTLEDIDRIEKLTPRLLENYRKFLELLSPLYAEEEAARELAPEISVSDLNEAYETIRQFIRSFDIDAIDAFISEVRKYRIPKLEESRFEAVEECVRNMDWIGLEEALRGLQPVIPGQKKDKEGDNIV